MDEALLRRAVELALNLGYHLTLDGLEYLRSLPNDVELNVLVKKAVELARAEGAEEPVLSADLLRRAFEKVSPKPVERWSMTVTLKPYASEVEERFEVVENPGAEAPVESSAEGFIEYFRDRFRRIERLMRRRIDVGDAVSLGEALKMPEGSKVKFICMVSERRESGRGLILRVEDLEHEAAVLVSDRTEVQYPVVEDVVICVEAVKGRGDLFVAERIVFPNVPKRRRGGCDEPVMAALISDLHVGSKMFLERVFRRFVSWLRMEWGGRKLREMAGRVKYILVCGDFVDGVGVYPNQEAELQILDIYEQYERVAELLSEVPDYVRVVGIPGNHDATRKALPQPPVFDEYSEPLKEANVTMLGNPARIRLHGVEFLMCHGRSLDDVLSTVSGMSFEKPELGMEYLIACRHLAPMYGYNTPIAPSTRDYLVIETPPDVLHMGHVHIFGYKAYKGILLVNSGTFQGKTEYQRRLGIEPTPGIVPLVDLKSMTVYTLNLMEAG